MSKEIITDFWVNDLLKSVNLKLDPQGSNIPEINEALKTASKNKTKKGGRPEFVGVVNDYVIVIEDKSSISNHIKLKENVVCQKSNNIKKYAVNGALFYLNHILENTNYNKGFAIGVSGNEKFGKITPVYKDIVIEKILEDIDSFINLTDKNIDKYYKKYVLNEELNSEIELKEVIKISEKLNNDLTTYGAISDKDKPLIVSGILLALMEIKHKSFSLDSLIGDTTDTDGSKIYNAIKNKLRRSKVTPDEKKDKLLSNFMVFKNTIEINTKNEALGCTPIKHYTKCIYDNIFNHILKTSEDFLGRFYSEFMSYSGGDGQSLGIILTPKHITDLFCDLIKISEDDVVLDPCCGTGGFLVSALHNMIEKAKNNDNKIKNIKSKQLHGIELSNNMFTLAATNMILRDDGKSNILNKNFLNCDTSKLQLNQYTVGMLNPPYSQGKKTDITKYEINFINHMLNSLVKGGRGITIVPQGTFTGKSKYEKNIKEQILKNHTLEGIITLNPNTFYGVGTLPVIAIFTAHEPHPKDKICKFINFKDDGFKVSPHTGLLPTENVEDKKQHLLDVWFDRIEETSKFCIKTKIKFDDEWLHNFYYSNDNIPELKKITYNIGNNLTFKFNIIIQDKENYFKQNNKQLEKITKKEVPKLEDKKWDKFKIEDIFNIESTKFKQNIMDLKEGEIPLVSSTEYNNGVSGFYDIEDKYLDSNFISINNDGSVGFAFYHDYKCVITNHCRKLKFKEEKYRYNEFISLFVCNQIMEQKDKYNFGYAFGLNRLKRQYIMLPIDDSGNIDYEYMEQFVKNITYDQYKKYIEYIKSGDILSSPQENTEQNELNQKCKLKSNIIL